MVKPRPLTAKPLSALLGEVFAAAYAKQGFASRELVTRWREIAGADVAEHSEPMRIAWPRPVEGQPQQGATLMLRVEGPMALEIQHCSDAIVARVNRFFGWNAIARIALRQAPLSRPMTQSHPSRPDPQQVAAEAKALGGVEDDELRDALARLGAAIKRS